MAFGPALIWRMGGDTSKFDKSLNKSKKSVTTFASSAMKRLGPLIGAAGIGGLISKTFDLSRRLRTLSSNANVNFESFQRQAQAAKKVNLSMKDYSDILRDLQDRIGDFIKTGGGPMQDFFEQIAPQVGVTARQFRELSGDQAMQLYFDSLKKANVAQSEMTFFMEAIASEATRLIPLLENNGEKLKELGKDASVMSEEAAKKFDDLGTRIDNLTRNAQVLASKGLFGIVRAFESVGEGAALLVNKVQGIKTSFGKDIPDSAKNTTESLGEVEQKMNDVGRQSEKTQRKLSKIDFQRQKILTEGREKANALLERSNELVKERNRFALGSVKHAQKDLEILRLRSKAQEMFNKLNEKENESSRVKNELSKEDLEQARNMTNEQVRQNRLESAQNDLNSKDLQNAKAKIELSKEDLEQARNMTNEQVRQNGLESAQNDLNSKDLQNAKTKTSELQKQTEELEKQNAAKKQDAQAGIRGSGELATLDTAKIESVLADTKDELRGVKRQARQSAFVDESFVGFNLEQFVKQAEKELATRRRFRNATENTKDLIFSPFEQERLSRVTEKQTNDQEQKRLLEEIRDELETQTGRTRLA